MAHYGGRSLAWHGHNYSPWYGQGRRGPWLHRGRWWYGHGRRWPWLHRGVWGGGDGLIPSPMVTWAQGCLAQLLGPGVPQDGIMGPGTRQAIEQFQMQQQLQPTGMLDENTVSALQAVCRGQQSAQDGGGGFAPAPPAAQAPAPQPARKPRDNQPPTSEIAESEGDVTLDMPPKPPYLKFMKLDKFILNEASLTADLRQMVEVLAKHVKLSWTTTRPIAYIRLIGHTDITGPEKYNLKLGNRRAEAVKNALEHLLKDDILKRRIAILVDPSPGASAPTADNRTEGGRALNRRVEVFVAPPEPPPPSPPPLPPPSGIKQPKPSIIQTTPDPIVRPGPARRGRSLKDWFNQQMDTLRFPKWLRDPIWDSVFNENWGLVANLLGDAGVSRAEIQEFIATARALAEVKVQ